MWWLKILRLLNGLISKKFEISFFQQVKFEFSAKVGNVFRTFMNVDKIDWCYIMEKTNAISNSHFKALLKDLIKSIPRLFVPCPFIGLVDLLDVPPQEKFISIIPSGCYRIYIVIKDIKTNLVVKFLLEFENYHWK